MAQLAREASSNTEFRERIQFLFPPIPDAIDRFLRSLFRYREEIEEIIRTPQHMLEKFETDGFIEGDCDDIATLYAAIFGVFGWPSRFVAIRYDAPEFQHVFLEAMIGGAWKRFDATVPVGTVHKELERMVVDL
jgi:transglutaminase-like putative cysteine protease